MEKRKLPALVILLFISIYNFYRIKGDENIRLIQFLTIFVIGALSALLIISVVKLIKDRSKQK